MRACRYVCMYVCLYVCISACTSAAVCQHIHSLDLYIYICIQRQIYTCSMFMLQSNVHVCMYVCVYIYIRTVLYFVDICILLNA